MKITKIKHKIKKPLKNKREELLQDLITKLIRVIKKIHRGHNFPFGNSTLNRQQIMILFFIAEKEKGAAVKELANFLQVTPGAITQFTDVLVKYKLVRRESALSDRRLTKIKLSPSAKIKFKKFKINYFASLSTAFNNFQNQELRELIKLVEKIKI